MHNVNIDLATLLQWTEGQYSFDGECHRFTFPNGSMCVSAPGASLYDYLTEVLAFVCGQVRERDA